MIRVPMIINIEGPDGSGKTTQINMLADKLKKDDASFRIVKQPGTSKVGNEIRNILKNEDTNEELEKSPWTERLLFAADHACMIDTVYQETHPDMLILSDRNTFISDIAYGVFGLGMDLGSLKKIHSILDPYLFVRNACVNIVLSVDLDTCKARMKKRGKLDRIESRGDEFMEKVIRGYNKIGKNSSYVGDVHLVDGTKNEHSVHKSIKRVLENEQVI